MITSKTPYRISFFGGGTDYPDWFMRHGQGAVLSTTIDKYCYITCRVLPPFFETKHRIVWSRIELASLAEHIQHPVIREGLRFLGFNEEVGLEIHHQGDLPARAGMGSSSAFAVGMIKAFLALRSEMVSPKDLAKKAIELEHKVLQENVGYQDQIATAYGGLNRINFLPDGAFQVIPITISKARLAELESNLMLFYTGTSRMSSEIAKDIVANLKINNKQLKRMYEMVKEAIDLLSGDGELNVFGEMLDETWHYKRVLGKHVTNSRIDVIYAKAKACGALGGKLLGAGSSGFMTFYVPRNYQENVKAALKDLLHIPFRFETEGSSIIHYNSSYCLESNQYSASAAAQTVLQPEFGIRKR